MISGFPELLPAQRFVELAVLDRLRTTFELHGFAPLETPAVESLDQLLRKGEIDKEVYVLRRLHADSDSADSGHARLHFDLTVPFARYVLETRRHLEFPFRRYQIQKVWRGERPQTGRYREFTQADIDVVARDELAFHHDVEVARVMAEALSSLDFLPPLRMQVNNRRLMEGFFAGLGASDVPGGDARRRPPRQGAGGRGGEGTRRRRRADRRAGPDVPGAGRDPQRRHLVRRPGRALGVEHELLDTGLAELAAVIEAVRASDQTRVTVEADLRIARGLDYYTGTVFETRMAGYDRLGSICSGGRYDSLASDGKVTYPGVGISLGVTRMLVPLFQRRTRSPPQPLGPVGGAGRVGHRRRVARGERPSPKLCGSGGSPPRSRRAPRSSASRSATPNGAASRSSGSPGVTRLGRRGEGHPQR